MKPERTTCERCGNEKPLSAFPIGTTPSVRAICNQCREGLGSLRNLAETQQAAAEQRQTARRRQGIPYKLTPGQRAGMLVAARCALCGSATGLVIDHDHTTGAVRGVLCGPCNIGLGMFRDRPDLLLAAVEYLRNGGHRATRVFRFESRPTSRPVADPLARW